MTTIAYRDGVLAADRQVSDNGRRFARTTKIHRLPDGRLYGLAGDLQLMLPVRDWIVAGAHFSSPPHFSDDAQFEAVVVERGGVLKTLCKPLSGWEPITAAFIALGSGAAIAYGAMAMGADARKAVEVAARFDQFTGEGVDVLEVDA